MGLTVSEAGRLIWLSLLSFVIMMGAKFIVPLSAQPILIVPALLFIVLIYRTVPPGDGSTDFKVGLLVGANLTILVFEILHQITPLVFRGLFR